MDIADSNKQYSLRWEKHAFNLATEAGYFFEDESFLDCTLSAEGQCIDAHKIILSASSSYLSSLLKITPDKHPILIFNDMKFEQLKTLVSFIYNGSVNVSENNIHAFLNAAQSLLIKGLSEDDAHNSENNRSPRNVEIHDKSNYRRNFAKAPTIRRPEVPSDHAKASKKIKHATAKIDGTSYVECEESLSKLQEISFTKYINQNLSLKPTVRNDVPENLLTKTPVEKHKMSVPENYVVKSWKHNSADDINGRNKNKNSLFQKFKLEKPPLTRNEENDPIEKHKDSIEAADTIAGYIDRIKVEDGEDKTKDEGEAEQIVLVEPKQEIIEEEDTNSEQYDDGHTTGSETMTSESESVFDGRSVPGYFQHPIVDRGVPVPLLMCKASLSEPDSAEPGWMPPVSAAITSDHVHHGPMDGSKDGPCRTCSQDLPCPTCTKKYKSRYALNRHVLYECGKARKSFSCDECGKKVTRQDTLQKHKLIHLVQHLKDKETESDFPEPPKMKKKC